MGLTTPSRRFQALRGLLAATPLLLATQSVTAQSVTFADFEYANIPIVNPGGTSIQTQTLWNQYTGDFYEGPDPGMATLSTEQAHSGNQSIKVDISSGNMYLQFYPHTNGSWSNLRDHIDSGTWEFNKFNRMRFWILVPPGTDQKAPEHKNFDIGTYVRRSNGDAGSAEIGGGHYYHHYNLKYTGQWHQIIMDMHPDHRRGDSGAVDQGVRSHPTGESNYNYFDALTRLYFDGRGALNSYPATYYLDGFEIYHDPNPENVEQVYSLSGVYVPGNNELVVNWRRHKDDDRLKHEVRYAFSDIHTNGWDSATPAPGGVIHPPNEWDYNGMAYNTTGIDMGDNSEIYIAIKPQNSDLFRQIIIPLDGGTPSAIVAPPNPPSYFNVSVVQ